jgi:hypothetical protein
VRARRGYRYAISVRQLELSDTRVSDRPETGRAWFEHSWAAVFDNGLHECPSSSAPENTTPNPFVVTVGRRNDELAAPTPLEDRPDDSGPVIDASRAGG